MKPAPERMTSPLRIGLLPFYLDLYSDVCSPALNAEVKTFAPAIAREYEARNVTVVLSDACCKRADFENAIAAFEDTDVDAIVTLHLAYSPSLESIDTIAATALPLIILDTTPDRSFGFDQAEERIMHNHGIHGVQDFCNLLLRHGKYFALEAGHWQTSDVIDRTVSTLRGTRAAKALRRSRVGIIGSPFAGMGDFAVPYDTLKQLLGVGVVTSSSEALARLMPAPDSADVQDELAYDRAAFSEGACSEESCVASEAAGLALRRWIDDEALTAVTMNFGDINGAPGLPVVPFLEASKAMARGIGYAGEGDVLTAAFCGALMQVAPETTFTEMFCPDWEGDRIFMSHMGEINLNLTAQTPVLEQRPYPFSAAGEPVIAAGCLKAGKAWLLNLAPGAGNTFTLVAAPVEVCDTNGRETIDNGIRGWIKPELPVAEFLTKYSLHGGTHHSVLSYGVDERVVVAMAKTMNWNCKVVR